MTNSKDKAAPKSVSPAAEVDTGLDSGQTLAIDSPARPEALPPEALPDETLPEGPLSYSDRYQAKGTLGRGGMGVVTLQHDHLIGRAVALKTALRGPGASRGGAWRFVREARVQGFLEHPAVVPVYDLGRDPEGEPFFTMQRVRGRSLQALLYPTAQEARGEAREAGGEEVVATEPGQGAGADPRPAAAEPPSLRHLLSLLVRVAQALEYVHHRGVIHRDLKPENIMIGDYGEVFLLDWGLAKTSTTELKPGPASASQRSDSGATLAGEVLGTPGYMAPEQLNSQATVDARADLYAFGAILYELLVGKPLHAKGELPQMIYSTMKLDGARLGENSMPAEPEDAAATDGELPPELCQLVYRLTRLDPEDRPSQAREVVKILEDFLEGERDASLRRETAERHLQRAREVQAEAGGDALKQRTRALQEVGRALALAPELGPARSLLFELLTQPPARVPPEAQAALEAEAQESLAEGARTAVAGYLALSAFVPIALWMGVRSWTAFLLLGGAMASCAAYTALLLFRPPARAQLPLPHLLLTSLTVGLASVMFGPLILVPMLAVSNSVSYLASVNHRQLWTIAAGTLAVVVPAVLQLLGVLPQSYVITNGVINVLPWMMSFPPLPTMAFLIVTQGGIVIAAGVFVMRLTRRAAKAERRLQLQAWQLQQLVTGD